MEDAQGVKFESWRYIVDFVTYRSLLNSMIDFLVRIDERYDKLEKALYRLAPGTDSSKDDLPEALGEVSSLYSSVESTSLLRLGQLTDEEADRINEDFSLPLGKLAIGPR